MFLIGKGQGQTGSLSEEKDGMAGFWSMRGLMKIVIVNIYKFK